MLCTAGPKSNDVSGTLDFTDERAIAGLRLRLVGCGNGNGLRNSQGVGGLIGLVKAIRPVTSVGPFEGGNQVNGSNRSKELRMICLEIHPGGA